MRDPTLIELSPETVIEHANLRIAEIEKWLPALEAKDKDDLELEKARNLKAEERRKKQLEWDNKHWFGSNPYRQTIGEMFAESMITRLWGYKRVTAAHNHRDSLLTLIAASKVSCGPLRLSLDRVSLLLNEWKPTLM